MDYSRNLYNPILSKIKAPIIAGLQENDQLKDSFIRGAHAKMQINRVPINFKQELLEQFYQRIFEEYLRGDYLHQFLSKCIKVNKTK